MSRSFRLVALSTFLLASPGERLPARSVHVLTHTTLFGSACFLCLVILVLPPHLSREEDRNGIMMEGDTPGRARKRSGTPSPTHTCPLLSLHTVHRRPSKQPMGRQGPRVCGCVCVCSIEYGVCEVLITQSPPYFWISAWIASIACFSRAIPFAGRLQTYTHTLHTCLNASSTLRPVFALVSIQGTPV